MGARNRAQGDSEEKAISKLTRMRLRAGSGSGPIEREDLIGREYLGQVKSFSGESTSLKLRDLEKLVVHAEEEGLEPVMFISALTRRSTTAPRKWAMVPLTEWLELNGRLP